jgi:leucyl aminopeptidase
LADSLSYIEKNYKPQFVMDFATLTGAQIIAL